MTSSSYTPEYWPRKMYRSMPLGQWLVARIAQHEALAQEEDLDGRANHRIVIDHEDTRHDPS